jgi:hypothetical protein
MPQPACLVTVIILELADIMLYKVDMIHYGCGVIRRLSHFLCDASQAGRLADVDQEVSER